MQEGGKIFKRVPLKIKNYNTMDYSTMNEKEIEKKSLMNSLERLNRTSYSLEDLSNLSYRLLQKFINPIPTDDVVMASKSDPKPTNLDLVDMFNLTNEEMENNIQNIGKNIDELLNIIE